MADSDTFFHAEEYDKIIYGKIGVKPYVERINK
jgi:hypothetical protein